MAVRVGQACQNIRGLSHERQGLQCSRTEASHTEEAIVKGVHQESIKIDMIIMMTMTMMCIK